MTALQHFDVKKIAKLGQAAREQESMIMRDPKKRAIVEAHDSAFQRLLDRRAIGALNMPKGMD